MNNSAIAGLSTNDYFGFNFEEDQNMLDENMENSTVLGISRVAKTKLAKEVQKVRL